MLRWAVIVLVLANAGYFAWTQGYLGGVGMAPVEQREPQRLAQQLRPEALRLLNGPKGTPVDTAAVPPPEAAPEAPSAATPAPAVEAAPPPPAAPTPPPPLAAAPAGEGPRACWQASGLTEAQAELLRAELALLGLGTNSWQLTETRSSGRWIVYMGRYDNTEQVERKKAELRGLGVPFRELTSTGLAPGLALGTYSTEAAARQALQQTERDGVRTAKVAQERAESVSFALRLPAITDAQRVAVDGLREAMAGKALRRCG